ncbi:LysR family transcriptional regulator [Acidisoma cladoniae]|jgi:DNA-binding transcriptional LysR family regulator|uniref:LysR family transcriptional regulator n=1 Tax=Acidisoma cladoniae TaxID=3040935 RepID=UPI00254FDE0E|nr:LysR family transcriptional regulator [Acidisoma sp. PAMC 29798]
MLDLIDVRAFVRIADLQSVSAAARALKAPKSSVSRSLARLEAEVGVVLVERSTRHLRLTDAGALFHPHALRILNDVDEAETALGSFAGVPRGTLRINAPYAFALALVAPMLPAFLGRYPEVLVTLDVDNRQVDVLAKQADLFIRIGPLSASGLIARRLATMELWACASPAYLAARGTPASVEDLSSHDLVGRVEGRTRWTFRTLGGETEEIDIHPRLAVPDPAPTQVVLAGGAGIGRLPDFMARSAIARGELVRVLAELEPGSVDVHAIYPSHRSLSAKVRVFIDALVAHMAIT